MVKVTFTLDDATVSRLQQAADRLHKSKSEVVREAVQEYHARIGRLSESERVHLLRTLDAWLPRIPARSPAEAVRELQQLREARRAGGRRTRP